jgi:hypothetical protein
VGPAPAAPDTSNIIRVKKLKNSIKLIKKKINNKEIINKEKQKLKSPFT